MQHIEPVTAAARYTDAQAIEAEALDGAADVYSDCIINAIKAGGHQIVSAPWNAAPRQHLRAWQVVQDLPCHPAVNDRVMQDLVQLLGQRIKAGDSFAIAIGHRIGAVYGVNCVEVW